MMGIQQHFQQQQQYPMMVAAVNPHEQIAMERARAANLVLPQFASAVQPFDRNGITALDYLYVGWRNGHIIP
jgi:hypothetical protein